MKQAVAHRAARLADGEPATRARMLRRTAAAARLKYLAIVRKKEAAFCLRSPVKDKEVMMGEGDDDGRTMATVMSVDRTTIRAGALVEGPSGLCDPLSRMALVGGPAEDSSTRDIDMRECSVIRGYTHAGLQAQADHQGDAYMYKETLSMFSRGGDASLPPMDVDDEQYGAGTFCRDLIKVD